jgi:hypothetical protein
MGRNLKMVELWTSPVENGIFSNEYTLDQFSIEGFRHHCLDVLKGPHLCPFYFCLCQQFYKGLVLLLFLDQGKQFLQVL